MQLPEIMPDGPGKYDDLATVVREQAAAESVLVVVLRGNRGDGFSIQATSDLIWGIPDLLRDIANQIEASLKKVQAPSPP